MPTTPRLRNPFASWLEKVIQTRVDHKLASMAETDDTIIVGNRSSRDLFRDRMNYDRDTILRETLLAWRTNPIARRIVDAIVEFVVGDGMAPVIKHKVTSRAIETFWNHQLNDLDEQIPEWVAEQSRTGDLFLLCSVDQVAGDMFVRAIPSETIAEIQTAGNDYRQEQYFIPQELGAEPMPAYDPLDPAQDKFVLHFPINRPVGCVFGESDLTPILKWLGRLTTLLNDRVIINHLRNLIVYVVTGKYTSSKDRKLRELELNSNPPQPGSIIVNDESEVWSTIFPNQNSFDAQQDILAIKKHIAAGIGLPLHYLAEPESSTRTTADAAGTPTFRKFKMRQNNIKKALSILCVIAVRKKRQYSNLRLVEASVDIWADDVTERDNSVLSLAAARIEPVLGELFDRNLIDEPTYLLLFYEMLGKDYDTTQAQPKGIKTDIRRKNNSQGGASTAEVPNEDIPTEADKVD